MAFCTATATPQATRASDTSAAPAARLVFSVGSDYPPLGYEHSGVLAGLDVDLIRRLGSIVGFEPEFRTERWADALASLASGESDAMTAALRSPGRDGDLAYTIPYYTDYYTIFSRRGSGIATLADVAGKRMAVPEGDAAIEAYLSPNGLMEGAILTPSMAGALRLVSEGGVDYTIAPAAMGMGALEALGIRDVSDTGRPLYGAEFRIAIREGNADLLAALNDAVARLAASGELERLRLKHRFHDRFRVSTTPPPSKAMILLAAIAFAATVISFAASMASRLRTKARTDGFAESIRILESALDAVPHPVAWKDAGLRYIGCNRGFLESIGLESKAEVVGREDAELPGGASAGSGDEKDRETMESGVATIDSETRTGANGERRAYRIERSPLTDRSGARTGLVRYGEDTSEQDLLRETIRGLSEELTAANGRLAEQRVLDPVSGAFNRGHLMERLRDEASRFQRFGQGFAALAAAIEDMPRINAERGAEGGDEAIRRLAATLRRQLRNVDIVGRLSGGRFVAILPRASEEEALEAGGRIASLALADGSEGVGFKVTFTAREYGGESADAMIAALEAGLKDATRKIGPLP
ncbi:MAG: transporter substrate-binding domain-containing protein [Spirochaetes bacterium]|nr:transporter substrate-binding domain-containing protein [Spirochaetota bacterium]